MSKQIIIVGQGICGTMLSYYLHQAGANVLVYDEAKPFTASKVASGVINPVTGRRLVKTWMIDELMPFAVHAYRALEKQLQQTCIQQCNILDFHASTQMQLAFDERVQEEPYLQPVQEPNFWKQYFDFPFGVGATNPCWLVDLQTLLAAWRHYLLQKAMLIEKPFTIVDAIAIDPTQALVVYCDGVAGFENPYFKNLPYTRMKGEALIVSIPDLPRQHIYKHGMNLVPWGQQDAWWVGSSYEWQFSTTAPTQAFFDKTVAQLQRFVKLPFTVQDHWAAERPANMERRPFVGVHPQHAHVAILNGMGTKGCSLAPFFAKALTDFLLHKKPIEPLADVQRFSKILSK